ncbi:hypothetical protein MNEG_7281 [Monoraphidium neglectum]|uniref:DUF2232 domain-containing protein n=1 Tax=Monoraphidium neglectum TaxID=145388 RepID=A0A0D2MJA5_9CHLO|nr:hypothetical protein MNEG_7281 [Monoraphidium neglectum]KIZ00682.1 hypothetical protein MNEG_7281 [Monoraphidium neglectum]|eukprot:XP_013899701.1 hypothetical protein MNEG_7281 [Monoraphidium neglectum]
MAPSLAAAKQRPVQRRRRQPPLARRCRRRRRMGKGTHARTLTTSSAAQALVETAMLAAVSGLAFLLSTLLKLDSSLGYFLPLPIVIAACRAGPGAGWNTMMATSFLLLVLLGPLRAVTYVLMHGMTAAALGTLWVWRWPWAASVLAGSVLRMAGQMGYLLLSSFTMNENLFAVMVANVHNLMDRLSASIGASGAPSDMAIVCMIFALLLVNAVCYNFLMHVIGHIALRAMGYDVGRLPGFMKRYLYGSAPTQQ